MENATQRIWFWFYIPVIVDFRSGTALIYSKRYWVRLLKIYDVLIGIKWTWQSIDSISIKSPLGGR
jgi:hypothetical protein